MLEILTYGFMQRAFLTGICISVACSMLGVFLILRRYALIGDGMAHIAFGGIALGRLFGLVPLISALVFALIGALGITRLREEAKLHGDTSIGIISHASLGIGIFVLSISRGFNVDILSFLFGSILSISSAEMLTSMILAVLVIAVIVRFYRELFALTFDEESAKAAGVRVNWMNLLLVTLTAVTVVLSMNVVGLLLASALIVLPGASALQVGGSFKRTILVAAIIAASSVVAGILCSYYLDVAASGSIVLVNVLIFLACAAFRRYQRVLTPNRV
jgi:zinc transport system permease protein